ncbi:MAG: helix-turn-helix transcriptional regulator [Longicatena sp.]
MKTYTVGFYTLINYGGNWQSDGTTTIFGYDEEFYTVSYDEALKEFEIRKKEITKDNQLGVSLTTWEDDCSIDEVSFQSNEISENLWLDEFLKDRILNNNKLSLMTGIPTMTLNDLKNGKSNFENVKVKNAVKIAKALDMSVEELYEKSKKS